MAKVQVGLTQKLVADAIRLYRGSITDVARAFGRGRTAMSNYIHKRPALRRVLAEARAHMDDQVEQKFFDDCLADGPQYQTSRIKYVFSRLRDRGFVDKHEVELTGPGGGPLVTEIVVELQSFGPTIRTQADPVDDLPANLDLPASDPSKCERLE